MNGPLVLFSGGIDSTLLLVMAKEQGLSPVALSFMYGAVHQTPEMRAAREIAAHLSVARFVCDLRSAFVSLRRATSLTGGKGSPVVPNRNAILLSVAVGVAETRGISEVWFGANASDHPDFVDCRPDFVRAMNRVAQAGTPSGVSVVAPLSRMTKRQVVAQAFALNVPLHLTWTCYSHGPRPCGTCDACRIRDDALTYAEASGCFSDSPLVIEARAG